MKTKITFEKESETSVKVLHNGKHIGNIWSESKDGTSPYPHDGRESTQESIQICGFTEASQLWACGIFHGTRDTVLRFNPLNDDVYKLHYGEYKEYVDECLKIGKPQLIKTFNDWIMHLGYPKSHEIKRSD